MTAQLFEFETGKQLGHRQQIIEEPQLCEFH